MHVTFARSSWKTPGVALQRQLDGEFMCIMGVTDPFSELLFKVSVFLNLKQLQTVLKWKVHHRRHDMEG